MSSIRRQFTEGTDFFFQESDGQFQKTIPVDGTLIPDYIFGIY